MIVDPRHLAPSTALALVFSVATTSSPAASGNGPLSNAADVGAVYFYQRVSAVFADDFESGGTSARSQTSP